MDANDAEPRVEVEQVSCLPAAKPGEWLMAWQIQNLGDKTLKVLSGRLPHSQFKCDEKELRVVPALQWKESVRLEYPVRCDEPPGTIVENAFLILRVLWSDGPWRILARLSVSINAERAPTTVTELITSQRVGFSALMKEES